MAVSGNRAGGTVDAGRTGVIRILPALSEHAHSLIADIRTLDNEEWVSASGSPTTTSLPNIISTYPETSWSMVDTGIDKCLAMFGVVGVTRERGTVWMLATREAERRVHSLHRLFREGIGLMHRQCEVLEAWAYCKNTLHHKWMVRMGFTPTGQSAKLGLGVHDFYLFIRRP